MERFTGSVAELGSIDVALLVRWIAAIPFEEWPQQHRLADGGIRPAMVTDLGWHGFGDLTEPVVRQIKPHGTVDYQRMLSVVMPGHEIEPHKDQQAPYWLSRVHVPLATNDESEFIVDGSSFNLQVGTAYLVNTLRDHAVRNCGQMPRIHFMFDLR